MNNNVLDEIKKVQKQFTNKGNNLSLDTKKSVTIAKRVDTVDEFSEHIEYISSLIEEELSQKMKFRKWFLYFSAILVGLFFVLLIMLYGYLIIYKNHIPSDKVLIGISVTLFISMLGLINIVFKYLFSNTKDTTDYINNLRFRNNKEN